MRFMSEWRVHFMTKPLRVRGTIPSSNAGALRASASYGSLTVCALNGAVLFNMSNLANGEGRSLSFVFMALVVVAVVLGFGLLVGWVEPPGDEVATAEDEDRVLSGELLLAAWALGMSFVLGLSEVRWEGEERGTPTNPANCLFNFNQDEHTA